MRAERLRVARERQEALCKQMDAESRAPVVNPEPEAPRAAEVLRIPTDGTPEQIAAAALRIAEQHGLPPPTKRASAEESKRDYCRSSKRRRLMMLCSPRSSPRTSWTSASRP